MQVIIGMWSLGLQTGWALTLEISGMFNSYTIKTLKSWDAVSCRSKFETKLFTKCRKYIKPLAIGKEGTMAFQRLTAIKFLRAIITGTFRALLTLGIAKSGNDGSTIILDSVAGTAT